MRAFEKVFGRKGLEIETINHLILPLPKLVLHHVPFNIRVNTQNDLLKIAIPRENLKT